MVDRIRHDRNGGPVVWNMPQIPVGGFLGVLDAHTTQVETRPLFLITFSLKSLSEPLGTSFASCTNDPSSTPPCGEHER
jgi:hypothetical protein